MKSSKASILTFAYYFALMSGILIFYPSLFLYLGFESITLPWVTICGYLIGVLSYLYFMAAVPVIATSITGRYGACPTAPLCGNTDGDECGSTSAAAGDG